MGGIDEDVNGINCSSVATPLRASHRCVKRPGIVDFNSNDRFFDQFAAELDLVETKSRLFIYRLRAVNDREGNTFSEQTFSGMIK